MCLKLKECTNVWEMEGSLSKLSWFLDCAMGQGSTISIPVNTVN